MLRSHFQSFEPLLLMFATPIKSLNTFKKCVWKTMSNPEDLFSTMPLDGIQLLTCLIKLWNSNLQSRIFSMSIKNLKGEKKTKGSSLHPKEINQEQSKAAQEVVKAVSAQNKRKAQELVSVCSTIKPLICICVY